MTYLSWLKRAVLRLCRGILTHDAKFEKLAKWVLQNEDWKRCHRDRVRADYMSQFINHWWLRLYGSDSHWSKKYQHWQVNELENEFALIFFEQSLYSLQLESKFEVIYKRRADIPSHLKTASFFVNEKWYRDELIACAAYIGKKQAWPLYNIMEAERICQLYPLRCSCPDDYSELLTKSQLKKMGFSDPDIQSMIPVCERQNRYNSEWYCLYQLPHERC
ncbi:hypothetical protein Xmir_03247 [Xenorhabdus miraniensis]|uniref:Uncharacterized protein n=1 Tax=Xenorhabdus miraniensis TaxID=351674 RepID=A0A2D0JMG4_9GAMM|nr:hypothetical protein Xmir_03247 [Xenorhabdus miraniensis]